jgi:hypothetical protein
VFANTWAFTRRDWGYTSWSGGKIEEGRRKKKMGEIIDAYVKDVVDAVVESFNGPIVEANLSVDDAIDAAFEKVNGKRWNHARDGLWAEFDEIPAADLLGTIGKLAENGVKGANAAERAYRVLHMVLENLVKDRAFEALKTYTVQVVEEGDG